ncbi:MAG: hypothetical protein AAF603_09955, partial [Pseudomonadota bacterium]
KKGTHNTSKRSILMTKHQNDTKLTKEEARQGERIKGMPSVLTISTLTVTVIFLILLLMNI